MMWKITEYIISFTFFSIIVGVVFGVLDMIFSPPTSLFTNWSIRLPVILIIGFFCGAYYLEKVNLK